MEQGEDGVRAQAERLTQLANLHGKGVPSDEEYEAAVARVVGADPLPPRRSPSDAPQEPHPTPASDPAVPATGLRYDRSPGPSEFADSESDDP